MRTVPLGYLPRQLGRHVGVAVTVGAYPAARMEEGRTDGRHGASLVAQLPVIETSIDLRNHIKERMVKDIDDGLGLLDGSRLLDGDGRSAQKGVYLLEHPALVLGKRDTTCLGPLLEQGRDAPNLAFDGLAARLGGMCREDGMKLQTTEKRAGLVLSAFLHESTIGNRDVVDRILIGDRGNGSLACTQ